MILVYHHLQLLRGEWTATSSMLQHQYKCLITDYFIDRNQPFNDEGHYEWLAMQQALQSKLYTYENRNNDRCGFVVFFNHLRTNTGKSN